MAVPAHQPFLEDDTDEDMSDEQVRELLNDAERRLRAEQASKPTSDVPFRLPKLNAGPVADTYLRPDGRIDPTKLVSKKDQALANGIKKIEDPIQIKKQKLEPLTVSQEKKATAGSNWFNLPATDLTPELRRDLQLLKMRNVLDPHRHYKKSDSKSDVPAFSQVGTIIEGPTEYYNARINKKDRKTTIMEEVMSQEQQAGRFKRKYDDYLKTKTSGKKAFYKALKAKRNKGKVVKP
ncbi:rRNA-processing protein FCF2 [Corynespora cassiicola Philippines]|uniref:rRNA-processing protein FCF2 n=1 Tax=Corynespora cassiicola Philippines TaxID=1448308 RepID=A0A2T2P0K4_CORCC|nr:rRNA-processing protein FCF2 [Corynespora cassiicola Philippines]